MSGRNPQCECHWRKDARLGAPPRMKRKGKMNPCLANTELHTHTKSHVSAVSLGSSRLMWNEAGAVGRGESGHEVEYYANRNGKRLDGFIGWLFLLVVLRYGCQIKL